MNLEELMTAIQEMGAALRTEVADSFDKVSKRCDALDEKLRKADEAGSRSVDNNEMLQKSKKDNDDTLAEQTAADSVAVANSLLHGLARDMTALKKQISRPMGNLDQFAEVQSKADAVLRLHSERAEPPMAGEDIVSYNIRMARKMQPHSKTWAKVDLRTIAADSTAFGIAVDGIRSDAYQAGMNPVHLPEFQHRQIVQESPGGHRITSFVGTGTIFKQMSRPVRHVAFIGTRH
jgi:hypothetical protein